MPNGQTAGNESKTTITPSALMRWAGLSAVVAGLCYVLVGVFHPANVPSSVTHHEMGGRPRHRVRRCRFFGLLGLAGLYARQAREGRLAWADRLPPAQPLVRADHGLQLRRSVRPAACRVGVARRSCSPGWGCSTAPPARSTSGPFRPLDAFSPRPHPRRSALRHRDLPRRNPAAWAGALLAASTVLAPIAALLPNASQPKIAIPMGFALAWLGYALWSEQRAEEALERPGVRRGTAVAGGVKRGSARTS